MNCSSLGVGNQGMKYSEIFDQHNISLTKHINKESCDNYIHQIKIFYWFF